MYLSVRGFILRNAAAAIVNGVVTLILLLIAPLGLAAVITNTIAVSISTFLVCSGIDLIVNWLIAPYASSNFFGNSVQMSKKIIFGQQKNASLDQQKKKY